MEAVRKVMTRKYLYLIYYSCDANEIVILTIRHSARERSYQDR